MGGSGKGMLEVSRDWPLFGQGLLASEAQINQLYTTLPTSEAPLRWWALGKMERALSYIYPFGSNANEY